MLEWIKKNIKNLIWKIRNRNNDTTIVNGSFPIQKVTVGDYSYGRLKVVAFGMPNERLVIGRYCSIADDVVFLLGGGHSLDTFSTFPVSAKIFGVPSSICKGPIEIEDDVWIGYRATILSGVHIGRGAVVAAGALVNKDVPAYSIVGGVPARIIRKRISEELITSAMEVDYSNITPQLITANRKLFTNRFADKELQEIKVLTVKNANSN